VGAGASGAVFGIAGVLIVLLKSPRLPIPPKELSGLRRYVIYFAAINFVIGFGSMAVGSVVHIDNMAHLGGFLGGSSLRCRWCRCWVRRSIAVSLPPTNRGLAAERRAGLLWVLPQRSVSRLVVAVR
jgi:membrane associated rhomboid family serine protease